MSAQSAVSVPGSTTIPALDEILDLSDQMLAFARSADWERLAGLEITRRERIHRYFEGQEPTRLAQVVAELIRKVLDTDREIVTLVEAGKSEFESQFRRVAQGRKARSAYASNSG